MKDVWKKIKSNLHWVLLVVGSLVGFIFGRRVRRPNITKGLVSDSRDGTDSTGGLIDAARDGVDNIEEGIGDGRSGVAAGRESVEYLESTNRAARNILEAIRARGENLEDRPRDDSSGGSG